MIEGGKLTVHSRQVNAKRAWSIFRVASASVGGGTPPAWTQCGDNPDEWSGDAAGRVFLWDVYGLVKSFPALDARQLTIKSRRVVVEVEAAGYLEEAYPGPIRAMYVHDGGSYVVLRRYDDAWFVDILRPETPSKKKKSNRGKETEWRFRATTREFNGSRVVKEALVAGFELVSLSCGGRTVTLATFDFMKRLRDHGLFDPDNWIQTTKPIIFCLNAEGQIDSKTTNGFGYGARWRGSTRTAQQLVRELAQKALAKTYIVTGHSLAAR